jgi:sugar phosphate isomerase/epimerase
MLLAINGATTMKATLPEDIAAASAAGFRALEIWAAKMDTYLEANTVDELKALFGGAGLRPASINSIW